MRHFGKKMMFLATMVMALTMIIWTAGAKADSVIIGNNGYPYGKNMTSSITFIVDVAASSGGVYQWYESDSSDGNYSVVANKSGSFEANADSFETTFTPTDGKWYKCRINNEPQCETQPVMAKKANGRWYISNGTMAYSFFESNARFDVIGQINGTWVTQTSYDTYWNFYTSTEATPAPSIVEGTSPISSATLKSAKARFSTSNRHVVNFEATIGENEHAFAFGCDVKIRNNDYAPTTAIIASRTGSVKQMQLVDTGNLATAADTDPAMVVKYTTIPTHFWIGKWTPRYYYATNDKNTSTCYIDNYCSWNDAGVCYQYQGGDSGMTVSWTNRNGGDTIGFSFALGTVAETGAITGKIDYSDEKIESLKANTTYVITVLDEDGNPTSESYTITSDSNGAIHLSGTDDNNNEYDLIGKSIQIGIKDSMADPAEMDIAPRPDAENPHQSSGTDTYIKPEDVSDNEVSTTQNSITIKPLSETGKKQKYRLYTSTGEEISGQDWMPLGADGTITFAGLSPNTSYLVKAYLPATQSAPRSEYTSGTLITTLGKINVTLPSPTEITYDGDQHTFQITVNPADAAVAYSTSESVDYSNTIPTFANAGDYTVYYRVLKENYTSEYGSFPVKIKKAVNPTTVSGGTVGKGGKVLDLTSLVTMNGATGDLTYSIQGNNLGCSISGNVLTTGQNTGNITIKVVVASDDNYQEKTVTTNVEITSKGQQTLQFEEPSVEKTYDPTPFVNALSGAKTTVTYEVTNGTDVAEVDESNGFVTIKKVGSATITASAIETDEYYAAATSFILTVNKASFDSTVSISGWTYGSTASAPTVSNNPEGGNVTYVYYTDEECNTQTTTSHGATEAGGRPSYAGNYWVKATIAETANYASVTTAAVGFTISPAALAAANVTITEAVKNGTPSTTATQLYFQQCDMGSQCIKVPGRNDLYRFRYVDAEGKLCVCRRSYSSELHGE